MITPDVCTGSVRINGEPLGDSTVTSTFTLDKLVSTQWEMDASPNFENYYEIFLLINF
jgi:hypothetical protein